MTTMRGELFEEKENKATLLCNHATFAYTGLADMGVTEKTHELLLRSLGVHGSKNFDGVLDELGRNATRAVRSLVLPGVARADRAKVRRTAFVGAGFLEPRKPDLSGLDPSPDGLQSFICLVSNAQTLAAGWEEEASRDFSVELQFVPQGHLVLHATGVGLSPDYRRRLVKVVRRCVRRGLSPNSIARLLTRAIRAVSSWNGAVGGNVMSTIVRRADARKRFEGVSGSAIPLVPELFNEAQFFKLVKDDRSQWIYCPRDFADRVHYMPNVACNGLQMTTGLFGPEGLVAEAQDELGEPNTRRRRR
ncbi:hypothetical protein [Actinomycetospora sp. NBC_00405]|uniref:hypothetical protein n=1 Tax=Actinomycetospora sp. NBC_00405 TaxID=2975952 RepID=UPI002E1F1850